MDSLVFAQVYRNNVIEVDVTDPRLRLTSYQPISLGVALETESFSAEEPTIEDERPRKSGLKLFDGKKTLMRLLIMVLGTYLFILAYLSWSETALVYPGSKYPKGNWEPKLFAFEEIEFESKDGTKLGGWYLPPPVSLTTANGVEKECRTILICHGNAENCAEVCGGYGLTFRDILGAEVFAFDYRGYGKSEGAPFERGVFEDAEAALAWLCEKSGKQPDEVILVGHSLGGGPAVHLANTVGGKMLILQRTFSSLPDAASFKFPFIPASWLMRNQMDSAEAVRDCRQPLFQSHGDKDKLIPIELARELFANSPSDTKEFYEVPGMTHWDPLPIDYWQKLKTFVNAID